MSAMPGNLAAWHADRRLGIGASEWAAVLGLDPRRGPLAVYASKLGYEDDFEDAVQLRRGRRLEPVIADEYASETGRTVQPAAVMFRRHPSIPWLGATPDRYVIAGAGLAPPEGIGADEVGALELKAVLGPGKWREWQDGAAPDGYEIQLQAQLFVLGLPWGSLAGYVGGLEPVIVRDRLLDQAFIDEALPVLERFWRCVERREPPPANDPTPGTSAAVRRLWPRADGTTVDLDPEVLEIVERWQAAKDAGAKAEREEKAAENELRGLLGSASYGALVDGTFLKLTEVERDGYTVPPVKFRQLRRWRPKLRARR